jgi:predicted metalloprotease with PDZ domain
MITKDELISQLNKRAKDYYENPRLQVTNQFAGEHLFVDGEATLIPYGRGFFYLLHMDEIIRKATGGKKSLDDVVLAILKRTRNMEECGNPAWLEEVQRIAGIDVSGEFEEMQNGKVFIPTVTSFQTPVRVLQSVGIQRETGKECILYQFE